MITDYQGLEIKVGDRVEAYSDAGTFFAKITEAELPEMAAKIMFISRSFVRILRQRSPVGLMRFAFETKLGQICPSVLTRRASY